MDLESDLLLAKYTADAVLDGLLSPEAGRRFLVHHHSPEARQLLQIAIDEATRRRLERCLPGGVR